MLKKAEDLEKLNRRLRREKTDYKENLRIVNALYQEAVALGVFPLQNPLDGIEVDKKIAYAVNNV